MYSTALTYLLWFLGGFGALGFHRFYLGKIGTGLLYMFTGGLAGIGCVYDFFTIPMQVRDANVEARYRRALDFGSPYGDGPQVRQEFRREIGKGSNKDTIERVILRTAKKNSGIATPSEVALDADISLDDAKKNLEQLVSRGFAEVRVNRNGTLVYVFPDFATDDTERNLEDF